MGSLQSLLSFPFHCISSLSLSKFALAVREESVPPRSPWLADAYLEFTGSQGILPTRESVSSSPLKDSGYIRLRLNSVTSF